MAISKIILNGVTQMDLTNDTTDASKTLASYTGHGADGEAFTGSYVPQIGVDIPVFTDDGQTITCNKTFAECLDIVDNGKTAAMITDGYGWEASISANIYSSSQITYTLCDNLGKPNVDFIYNSNGTISSTTPSHASPVLTTKSITANGTYNASSDNADGYSSVTVNVPSGGSSNFTLLGTQSVGTVNTTSTQAADTGVTITVKGVYGYDLLVCECSVNTKTNGRHAATTRLIWLTASSNVSTKDGATFATATWNCKLSSNGTATTRSNTTAYGVYANGCTLSAGSTGDNGQAVITIYRRYNSTQTGTINGSYTMRVYGVKIYDLIGG